MNDHARAPLEHRRQQRPIEPDRRQQVEVERAPPFLVVEHGEAARRRRRAAQHMNEDVDAAEPVADRVGHGRAARKRRDIRRDEKLGIGQIRGPGARRSEHRRAGLAQPADDGRADALGAARDQDALAEKFTGHRRISVALRTLRNRAASDHNSACRRSGRKWSLASLRSAP